MFSKIGAYIEEVFDEHTGDYEIISDIGAIPKRGDSSLEIPFYKQLKSYTCGYVAGAMIVHAFDKRRSLTTIWDNLTPNEDYGLYTHELIKGLRKMNVGVNKRHNLSFKQICNAINKGHPICVTIDVGHCEHWVVIYGVNEENEELLLAGNGLPYLNRHRYTWEEFKEFEGSDEEFLICWGN